MPIRDTMLQKFFQYIHERERIRMRKEAGEPRPWTNDWILNTFKFTNVFRKYDRTTLEFLNIYDEHAFRATPATTLLNCAYHRYFGTGAYAREHGWCEKWDSDYATSVAVRMMGEGRKVFTGSYIIPNQGRPEPKYMVVCGVMEDLDFVTKAITKKMNDAKSWRVGFQELSKIQGFGGTGFMAKEVLQDYLLTCHGSDFADAATWTPMGPGARRGINRLTGAATDFNTARGTPSDNYWLTVCLEVRERASEFTELELTAHDIQFSLCEFDKYCRAGEGGHMRNRYKETK